MFQLRSSKLTTNDLSVQFISTYPAKSVEHNLSTCALWLYIAGNRYLKLMLRFGNTLAKMRLANFLALACSPSPREMARTSHIRI